MALKPSRPTHNICIQKDESGPWHQVGVAWYNPQNGAMMIKLNPFVDLGKMSNTDRMYAFEVGRKGFSAKNDVPSSRSAFDGPRTESDDGEPPPDFGTDDIPF
jgi:hypothetical protein